MTERTYDQKMQQLERKVLDIVKSHGCHICGGPAYKTDGESKVWCEKCLNKAMTTEPHKAHKLPGRNDKCLCGSDLKYKKLPEDSTVQVDFVEPEFPLEPQEYRNDIDWRVQNNYTSKIEILMEMNPDLTREEAEKKYQQILEDNRKLRALGTPGATENAILEGLQE